MKPLPAKAGGPDTSSIPLQLRYLSYYLLQYSCSFVVRASVPACPG